MSADGATLYQPLDKGTRQIRLIRKMSSGSQIRCHLSVFSLDDAPEYKALSYCWGLEEATCRIYVNGEPFSVRPNLFAYLQLLSQAEEEGWIFVDALCINQDDVAERSSQVGFMGDVYRSAAECVAWLGSGAETNGDKLSSWQRLCDSVDVALESSNPDDILSRMAETQSVEILALLAALCSQPYWRRLWVVQELMLGESLAMRYKTLQVTWEVLLTLLEVTYKHELLVAPTEFPIYDVPNDLEDSNNVVALGILRIGLELTDPLTGRPGMSMTMRAWGAGGSRHLLWPLTRARVMLSQKKLWQRRARASGMQLSTAILHFGLHQCSLTHDKIFGLLGMAHAHITVDYSMSVSELYIHALIEGLLELRLFQGPYRACKIEEPILYTAALSHGLKYRSRQYRWNSVVLTSIIINRLGWPLQLSDIWNVVLERMHFMYPFTWTVFMNMSVSILWPLYIRGWTKKASFMLKYSRITELVPAKPAERMNYSAWVAHIETVYIKLLESKLSGLTRYASLTRDINRLASGRGMTKGEVNDLIKAISEFPTARESAELYVYALQQILSWLREELIGPEERSMSFSTDVAKANILLECYSRLSDAVQPRSVWGFGGVPDVMRKANEVMKAIEKALDTIVKSKVMELAALKEAVLRRKKL